jgi:hypothetical protein
VPSILHQQANGTAITGQPLDHRRNMLAFYDGLSVAQNRRERLQSAERA